MKHSSLKLLISLLCIVVALSSCASIANSKLPGDADAAITQNESDSDETIGQDADVEASAFQNVEELKKAIASGDEKDDINQVKGLEAIWVPENFTEDCEMKDIRIKPTYVVVTYQCNETAGSGDSSLAGEDAEIQNSVLLEMMRCTDPSEFLENDKELFLLKELADGVWYTEILRGGTDEILAKSFYFVADGHYFHMDIPNSILEKAKAQSDLQLSGMIQSVEKISLVG